MMASISGSTASEQNHYCVHATEGAPHSCSTTTVCDKTQLLKSSGGQSKKF
jgi:hypothetical protein